MPLPRHILDRVDRVLDFHQATKLIPPAAHAPIVAPPDPAGKPNPDRIFPDLFKVALPTSLAGSDVPAIPLMLDSLEALPESHLAPPQDLRTLASWLFLAAGRVRDVPGGATASWRRNCPSLGSCYPCEIYVAAFGIAGLPPGLYHFSPREFSLRFLCDGQQTFIHLKRGRPDLDFLKTTPAVMLISTVFSRSAWRFGKRGYRPAVIDAGQLVTNLCVAAAGTGIQTLTRLQINAQVSRELIRLPEDASFIDQEAVQAMIIWSERANNPLAPPPGGWGTVGSSSLPPLPRPPSNVVVPSYGSIIAVHADCVAPGVAVREIRPPVTQLSPLPESVERLEFGLTGDPPQGAHLGRTIRDGAPATAFERRSISRDPFIMLNRVAFRGGTAYPLFPDGPQPALVRPFWIIHAVTGLDPGIWYYHARSDRWSMLARGETRGFCRTLAANTRSPADGCAVALLCSNLRMTTTTGGPDAYRLAHLEAGMVAQRAYIAAHALGLSCTTDLTIFDDEARKFLGIAGTGWEVLHAIVVGAGPEAAEKDEDVIPIESEV